MKRVFPLIVLLITVSLLGIIYIQVNWIRDSINIRETELRRHVDNALGNVAQTIISEKTEMARRINGPLSTIPEAISAKQLYTNYELKSMIRKELLKESLNIEFEYCVNDQVNSYVLMSTGFKSDFFTDSRNMSATLLSDENSFKVEKLWVYFFKPESYVNQKMFGLVLSSLLFTAVIISAFALTIITLLRQKKISKIKNDFISNMTHEFKTPIATISLATDALNNAKVKADPEKMSYYTDIIKEENKRMNKQVETILQASQFEKEEIKLNLKPINVHEVITQVFENTSLQIEERQGVLHTKLEAANPMIMADEVHFSNIIFNLLDNAIKYSKEAPVVSINTITVEKNIEICFTDNGIGMSKDTINNIFEKFYRAHTGNLHNVKGFGLGLTYVKQVVEAHGGKIKVSSVLGKGSAFTIIFATTNKQA
jgi:two-component system, OmpR family, phosphate regulon sensor histidine kinase PhoR